MKHFSVRGSWSQRVSIYLLSSILGLLVYWLIGFVMRDIAALPGPQLSHFSNSTVQPLLDQEAKRLDQQIEALQKEMSAIRQQQAYVKNAMANTQNTINQILEIQRLQAQKGQAIAGEINKAFQQNTQLFLAQQNQLQQINNALTELEVELLPLQNHRQIIGQKLNEAYNEASKRYSTALESHRLNLGLLQVGILILLLLVVSLFLSRKHVGTYRPIYIAVSLALLIKIAFVIHTYFPSRYFKYVLTIALILVVFSVLKNLLQKRAFPAKEYLLKQYRDAYAHFLCPLCEYPIRRGPMRYVFWTRRSLAKLRLPQTTQEDMPYHCPQCGTSLYQHCQNCQQTRHTLLPYCEHCGVEKLEETNK